MFNSPKFDTFDPTRCKWSRYCQQLKFFLEAHKIKDNVKLPTVLSLIGTETFNLFCDLISPELPENKTVKDVFEILENHFSPKAIARLERLKFRKRIQDSHETITEFIAELRKCSINCNFKDNLESQLSDQLVFGIADKSIQKRLLIENDDIPLSKLIQIATAAETTAKDSENLNNSYCVNQEEEISYIKQKNPHVKPPKLFNEECNHCGSIHSSSYCKFKDATCFYCKKIGHIASICRKKKSDYKQNSISKKPQRIVHTIEQKPANESIILNNVAIKQIEGATVQPIVLKVKINDNLINFELDSGAAISLISLKLYNKYLRNINLEKTLIKLKSFNQNITSPLGKIKVNVFWQNNTAKDLELFVVKDDLTFPLLGRSWFKPLHILENLQSINQLTSTENYMPELKALLENYEKLFSPNLGQIKNFKAHITIKEGSTPKFFKHRPVPFALLPKIEKELEKLQAQGILESVKMSDWAAPIVPILKKDNTLRICADYKVGLNPCIKIDQYPLPRIDDILFTLARGTVFSKLDMSQAYQQVTLDDTSSDYLTINTHKGLFRVTRLPFGIASAPAIFQELMDKTLTGIPNTACYLDDILIASPNTHTHFKDLENVLKRLEEVGIHLNKGKCEFFKTEIEYLGHIVSNKGIQPAKHKVEALLAAPEPTNIDQLRSFLGLANYYRKFLPNLAATVNPLNILLCKNTKWSWGPIEKKAFSDIKANIASPKVLTHYNPNLPLILASDASPCGLGAVLSQLSSDGLEHPVAFASRTLTTTEKKYSQLDKEALGIIFALKKFHQFLFGRRFTLLTDHKPLTHIFGTNKQIPMIATARIQRWALTLSAYNYDIKFRTSQENANADALSRLPVSNQETSIQDEPSEPPLIINQLEEFPCTHKEIANETRKDPNLSQIMHYLTQGWPRKTDSQNIIPFFRRKDEISIQENCLLWGSRVIIPTTLRGMILKELHRHHTGIVRMKMLARSLFWWPSLDKNIEQISNNCYTCRHHAKDPPKTTVHHWIRPNKPGERVHVDFAGPVQGHMFLVVVDAYSKWPEVTQMTSIDTIHTAYALESYFSRFGYPVQLVSDNGTQFTSAKFAQFCKNRGIHHTLSPPYHPASNGQAERFVQTLKTFLAKMDNFQNLTQKIYELLFAYRSTPHTSTGKSPAELFLGRNLRNRLQLIKPPENPELSKPYKQTQTPTTKLRTFAVGEQVYSRVYSQNKLSNRWEDGTIYKKYGPVTYLVKLDNGRFGKRHIDQLLKQKQTTETNQYEPEPRKFPPPLKHTYHLRKPETNPTKETHS